MTIQHKLWISIAIVASLSGGLLLLAFGRAPVLPPTDREAVMRILDQRGVVYTDAEVRGAESGVPQDHFAYVAAVVVQAERTAYGKIECLSSDDCVLWVESLGVYRVPLPPSTSLWGQINQYLDTVLARLRAWLAPIGQR